MPAAEKNKLTAHDEEGVEEETCLSTFFDTVKDGSNTLRSFFGTNILTMAWAFSVLGAALGPIATVFCALIVFRATQSLIRVKQSLPNHAEVVTYGGVVSAVAGHRGQVIVDILVAFTQFTTCISYVAFSSKNLHSISGIEEYLCVLGLVVIIVVVSLFHNAYMLAKISIVTNTLMFTGIGVILTTIDFQDSDDVDLFLWGGLPIGMATLSSSLGGITTVLDVERTMTNKPGRYLKYLSVVLPTCVIFLSAVGLMGYMTYGSHTCAVLSLSIKKGSWQQYVTQSVLTLGPCLEGVLNSFPLFVITEKYFLGINRVASLAEKHPNMYFYSHRVLWFIPIGLLAYGVPFIGYISSINGAVGYASLSFLVPVACEYLRSKTENLTDEDAYNTVNYDSTRITSSRSQPETRSRRGSVAALGASRASNASRVSGDAHQPTTSLEEGLNTEYGSCAVEGDAQAVNKEKSVVGKYIITKARKIELVLIFVFGVTVVCLGTIFALKDIVAQLDHTAKKAVC